MKKANIRVIIYVSGFKIFGNIHLPIGGRLTDFLNTKGLGAEGEVFIPVTDVSIHDISDGRLLHYTSFLNVNKDKILFIFPFEDVKDSKPEKKD